MIKNGSPKSRASVPLKTVWEPLGLTFRRRCLIKFPAGNTFKWFWNFFVTVLVALREVSRNQ